MTTKVIKLNSAGNRCEPSLTVHGLYKFDHNAEVQILASSSQIVFWNAAIPSLITFCRFCGLLWFDGGLGPSIPRLPLLQLLLGVWDGEQVKN